MDFLLLLFFCMHGGDDPPSEVCHGDLRVGSYTTFDSEGGDMFAYGAWHEWLAIRLQEDQA